MAESNEKQAIKAELNQIKQQLRNLTQTYNALSKMNIPNQHIQSVNGLNQQQKLQNSLTQSIMSDCREMKNADWSRLEQMVEDRVQKGLMQVFDTLDKSIQQRIEQTLAVKNESDDDCKCEDSQEYSIKESQVQRNKQDSNLAGSKDMNEISGLTSQVFLITPEPNDNSLFLESKRNTNDFRQKENYQPNSKEISNSNLNKMQRSYTKSNEEIFSPQNKMFTKKVQYVAQSSENIDPSNLKDIAFRLQQKLELKAQKLMELEKQNEHFSQNPSEGYQHYDEEQDQHQDNNEYEDHYENNEQFARMLVKPNQSQSMMNQMYLDNERPEGEYYSDEDEGEEEEFDITDQQTLEDKYFSSNISDIYSNY